MPTTPNYGFVFPSLSDLPNIPSDLEALAEGVDAALHTVETGPLGGANIVNGVSQAGGTGDAVLTFPAGTFAGQPRVVATAVGTQRACYVLSGGTATSVTVRVFSTVTGDPAPNVYFNWLAVGTAG